MRKILGDRSGHSGSNCVLGSGYELEEELERTVARLWGLDHTGLVLETALRLASFARQM